MLLDSLPLSLLVLQVRNHPDHPDPEAETIKELRGLLCSTEHLQLLTGAPLGPCGPGPPLAPGSPAWPFNNNRILLDSTRHSGTK